MFQFYASTILCCFNCNLFAKGWRKVVVGLARALVAVTLPVRESVKLRREEEPTKLSALYLLSKLLNSMQFMEWQQIVSS